VNAWVSHRGPISASIAAGGLLFVVVSVSACAQVTGTGPAKATAKDSARADSARRAARSGLIPAGYGTLRQDDISVLVQNLGLQVKVLPLEEGVIRTLSPDSYRSLHGARESKARQLDSVRARLGLPSVQAWSVTFFNAEQGEARFDAGDILIRSGGRDFRPLQYFPLKAGFGDGRLAQHTQQGAVYAFDPAIDLTQPITITVGTQTSSAWSDILQKVDVERSLVWSRSGAAKP
jgi:hypothetical protein